MEQGLINWVSYDVNDKATHPKAGKKLLIYGFYEGYTDSVFLGHGRFVRSKDFCGKRVTYIAHEPNGYPRLKNPKIDINKFSKVFWAYLFPPEFEPKSYHLNEAEIKRVVETANEQKNARVRLKDKQRQFLLDQITNGRFSEVLGRMTAVPDAPVTITDAFVMVELVPSALELSFYDPDEWNRFPFVEPPHSQKLECVFVESDQHVDRVFLYWNSILKTFSKDEKYLWDEDAVYATISDLKDAHTTLFFRAAKED